MAYNNIKVTARQTIRQSDTQTKDLGIVSVVPMDLWNEMTQYQKLNKIRYVSTGGSGVTLLAKKANKGVEPFISQGWQEVWMIENYDGGSVSPDGTYPNMTVGNSIRSENDGIGNNIANQFSEVVSDIKGLREDINTESHFRGMFESIDALRAAYPTATPNDYAYIVGGNIYIWQNDSWTDSGQPSPASAIPKGTSTPLMDGVGSSGIANAYAPIDHRHPENTNKVNKSGDIMNGKLTMAAGAEIYNGANDTFIEVGRTGKTGIEFHSQSDPSMVLDYDAAIEAQPAESTTDVGSAKLKYLARGHEFFGAMSSEGNSLLSIRSLAIGAVECPSAQYTTIDYSNGFTINANIFNAISATVIYCPMETYEEDTESSVQVSISSAPTTRYPICFGSNGQDIGAAAFQIANTYMIVYNYTSSPIYIKRIVFYGETV